MNFIHMNHVHDLMQIHNHSHTETVRGSVDDRTAQGDDAIGDGALLFVAALKHLYGEGVHLVLIFT